MTRVLVRLRLYLRHRSCWKEQVFRMNTCSPPLRFCLVDRPDECGVVADSERLMRPVNAMVERLRGAE